MKVISERWSSLNEEERKPYLELATQDKERRDSEMKNFQKNHPKHPPTSYILFCNEIRQQLTADNPDKSMSDLAKLMGEKWKSLSDEQKQYYIAESQKLKKEFQQKSPK